MKKYKCIDLFAGIGGIRKGFELTGRFTNVLSAEIDRYACETYEHLYGDKPNNDVTTTEFKEKVKGTDYDFLLAGFPCQSFSIAGKKEGFKDKTRGTLFFDIAVILEQSKPKGFLLENVEGLIKHDKGQTFKLILETLKEIGYKVVGVDDNQSSYRNSFTRSTKNFGLPQKRLRTYIIGFREDLVPDEYSFNELPKSGISIYKDLYDVIDKGVEEKYYLSTQYLETLKSHRLRHKASGNGFGFQIVNKGESPISNTLLATGGSGKERNLIFDPKPEIYGKVVKNKKTPLNSEGIRVMTPNEWAKLQGFKGYGFIKNGKDTFSFPEKISNAQRYKQLGNSVSIPVIYEMAKYILLRMEEFESGI